MANTVLLKIAVLFLVVLAGWFARRRGYLAEDTMRVMNRFVVDMAFPCLVFTQMLQTVDAGALRREWYLPLIAAGIILVAWLVGIAAAPVLSRRGQGPTFIFCTAIPNWVYLPLPIAGALYGQEGLRIILLYNVGAQILLWSLGVWILQGHLSSRQVMRQVFTNLGLIATVAGILLALVVPSARHWENLQPSGAAAGPLAAAAVVQALAVVGSLTIPLQLLVIGAQLGSFAPAIHRPSKAVVGVLLSRLVVAPAVTLAVMVLISQFAPPLPDTPRMCLYLIAVMPVALSCAMFTERFGGDVALGAQAIFHSTWCSLLTVPTFFYLIQRLGL